MKYLDTWCLLNELENYTTLNVHCPKRTVVNALDYRGRKWVPSSFFPSLFSHEIAFGFAIEHHKSVSSILDP